MLQDMSISWKSWLPLKVYSTQEGDSSACGNSCQSLLTVSLNRRRLNKGQKNSCVPPGVGRHHHLREECEKCQGENTVSGVQHATTGPAERPAHAAQSQLHTAADLRGERNTETDAHQPVGFPLPARGNTKGTVACSRRTRGKNQNWAVALRVAISARVRSAQLRVDAFPTVRTHRQEEPSERGWAAVWKPFWPLCCWQDSKLNCLHFTSQITFMCVMRRLLTGSKVYVSLTLAKAGWKNTINFIGS